MNDLNKIKHLSKRTLDSLFLERELSEPIVDLMHYERHLTEEQAKTTLNLFQNVDEAIAVANYFFSIPKKTRSRDFVNYNNYLNIVCQLVYFREEKLCSEAEGIFNEEIKTRECGLPTKVLTTLKYSSRYKNDPYTNSHQDQHFASQETPEVDADLEKLYLIRRTNTGL